MTSGFRETNAGTMDRGMGLKQQEDRTMIHILFGYNPYYAAVHLKPGAHILTFGGLEMNYDEFLSKIQNYADLDSDDKALKVIEATLRTLNERISAPHRRHLMTQLPKEFKDFTIKQKRMEYFSVEEFYKRVAARTESTYHEAIKNARAFMCVLQEAVARGELEDIFEELREGWDELMKAKPVLPISRYTVDAHELYK